jgi:N-terminal domain on NACHT_NTPase and P-loop NTPases
MSGIGEASLVLGLISSTMAIFEAAQEIYEAASDAKGLPKKFRIAAEQIPLVHNALSLAEQNINAKSVNQEALQSAKPVLERCKEGAASVKDIFDKTIPAKDASRAERLKKALGIKMKSNKVKEYMEEIVKSMELLAQNQVFQDAEALQDIKEAIEQLSNMPDEEEQPQFVHSGTGAINANTGGGIQKNYNNSGPGSQYNAENQFFGRGQGTDSS